LATNYIHPFGSKVLPGCWRINLKGAVCAAGDKPGAMPDASSVMDWMQNFYCCPGTFVANPGLYQCEVLAALPNRCRCMCTRIEVSDSSGAQPLPASQVIYQGPFS
jgi:hypothetical protein